MSILALGRGSPLYKYTCTARIIFGLIAQSYPKLLNRNGTNAASATFHGPTSDRK